MKTIALALFLGLAGWFLPDAAVEATARTLVLAVALMAAGVFPCMTLVVNGMKGEERTPALVEDLYSQLRILLKVLVAAFAVAVATVMVLALTAALAAVAVTPTALAKASSPGGATLSAAAAASGVLLGILSSRAIAIGKAFFAVLDLNRKQALLIARKKVRGHRDDALESSRNERFEADDPTPRKLKRVG